MTKRELKEIIKECMDELLLEESSNLKFYDINDKSISNIVESDSFCSKHIKYIRNNTGEVVVDTSLNKIAGVIFVGKNTDKGFISTLEVKPSYRRLGLGKKLLKDAINKYNAVDLVVFRSNKIAIDLYLKAGFVVIEKIIKDNKPAYWMKLKSKLSKDEHPINI